MRAIKHPSERALALHAGGDLGPLARWRCERHLKRCQACRGELAALRDTRRIVAELSDMPQVPWSRLAAEMEANIRLGLAAGECVGRDEPFADSSAPRFTGLRAALAMASLAVVVAAGLMLQRPPAARSQTVLEATADGIQLSQGGEALGLKHGSATGNVSYSANAQGSIGES